VPQQAPLETQSPKQQPNIDHLSFTPQRSIVITIVTLLCRRIAIGESQRWRV
jgi:hypothetical protein